MLRSPYSVITEPKTGRATRSCPGGAGSRRNNPNFRKYSPPFGGAQSTIHEMSGSYENFSMAQLEQIQRDQQRAERRGESAGRKADGGGERAGGKARTGESRQQNSGTGQKQHRNTRFEINEWIS